MDARWVMTAKTFVFRFGDVEVREREFSITRTGETLPVEPKAFRVLLLLLRNPGKLIPKQELLDAFWGDAAVTENSLARAVALLRKILGDEARTPRFIETVATVGYRFVSPVGAVEDSAAVSAAPDPDAPAAHDSGASTGPAVSADRPQRKIGRWVLAAATALVVFLAAGYWYLSSPLPPPRITAYTQLTRDGLKKRLGGTDGSRLYFTQFSPQTIMQVSVNGGEIAPLPLAVPEMQPLWLDISPDGSSALVTTKAQSHRDNPIWIAPLIGGSAKRLVEDGVYETFSRDGSSAIYATLDGDIFLVRIDGTEKRKLARVPSVAGSFSWSPDRKAIRFASGGLLWEMSPDGSGLHRLLPDSKEPGSQCCGVWSADGRFYLFTWYSPSSGSQIWALDERRGLFTTPPSAPIRLTTGPVRWGQLIPGRDAAKIFAEGVTARGELSRADPKSETLQPLLGGISAEFASFSPDGKSVAYVSYPDGALWKSDLDGSNRVKLTDGREGENAYNPTWSPDSKRILYSILSPGGHSAIYLVSAAGENPHKLLPQDMADMGDAFWSRDGKRVVFSRSVTITRHGDLRILDLDSGQVSAVPDSANMWSPRWSPDGQYILGMIGDSRAALRVFDFKTQQWSTLPVTGDAEFPSFSHDSRYIYFLRSGRDQGILRMPCRCFASATLSTVSSRTGPKVGPGSMNKLMC
jgi:Tol biopolymer transport system component/DNA-binding winged helix-turn-helix (wHTH) protein